jgi:hypothetical protein
MNEYGAMAQRHWQQHLPRRHASIDDPDAYFTSLGEQVAAQVAELWARMRAQAGNPPGEDYAARVGRLNAMRKQAEEIVLADLVLLPPEPGTGEDDAEA